MVNGTGDRSRPPYPNRPGSVGFFAAISALVIVVSCTEVTVPRSPDTTDDDSVYSDQALVRAIMDGDRPRISAFLMGDINPNARNRFGDTALIWAINRGDRPLAETLIRRGADPDLGGSYGRAPLHWACRNRFGDLVTLLLNAGAAVDLADESGETPLMQAVRVNDGTAVRHLLERGADPNHRNRLGATVLSLAVEQQAAETLEHLVLAGADWQAETEDGGSLLSVLVARGFAADLATPAVMRKFPGLKERLEAAYEDRVVNEDQRPVLDLNRIAALIHQGVNQERREHGLPPLRYDADLAAVALAHSEDMARQKFFAHVNPKGENPTRRAIRARYRVTGPLGENSFKNGIGENIFQGFTHTGWSDSVEKGVRYREYFWLTGEEIASRAVEGWMKSDGHRANILNPIYEREGIGLAVGEKGAVYITQNFW